MGGPKSWKLHLEKDMTTGGGGWGLALMAFRNPVAVGRCPIQSLCLLFVIWKKQSFLPYQLLKDPFQCLESPPELTQSLPFSLIVFVGDDLLLPKSLD